MCPYLFGFIDTYVLLFVLGIIAALTTLVIYLIKNKKYNKIKIIDVLLMSIFSILIGFIFAILFENLYELLESPSTYRWTWGMTFLGGLLGGVINFILFYLFYGRKRDIKILDIMVIAPACITIGHALGRLGCFFDGCCYGKQTDTWIGVKFPNLPYKVIPTQLIEMSFLIVLSALLLVFAFKKNFIYNFMIYTCSYGIFRFIIEFFRGDPRGGTFLSLYPSQWFSIILILITPLLYILINKINNKYEK